jgi:hypothetical protein
LAGAKAAVNGLPRSDAVAPVMATTQELTLVHFSAQRKRFLWNRECIEGSVRRG